MGRLLEETTLGEFLQAVESVRLRESKESVMVANGKHANANGKHVNANGKHPNANGKHANANGKHANANGKHPNANGKHAVKSGEALMEPAVANTLPTVGLYQARREATMPSLSGSVSRYFDENCFQLNNLMFTRLASEARRRLSMRNLNLQHQMSMNCHQSGAESLVLNGVSDAQVQGGRYCEEDILPV